MKKLLAALLLLTGACNPASRCHTASDCPVGATCSGGFCADYHAPGNRTEGAEDLDGPDAGQADAGTPATRTLPDGGPLEDGR